MFTLSFRCLIPRLSSAQLHITATRLGAGSVPASKPAGSEDIYEKQQDNTPEPRVSHSGTRTYVVSPKDSAPYDVPGGAYGSSDPYSTPLKTPAPQTSASASTAPGPDQGKTTARVPHDPGGVDGLRSSPGSMGGRGGSDGGLDLTDTVGVQGPNERATAEGGKQGLAETWKHKK